MRSNLLSPTPTWAYLLGLVLLAQVALAVPFPSSTSGGSALARSTVKQPNSVDDGTLLDDVAHPSHHARTTKPESVDDGFFEPTSVDDGTILELARHSRWSGKKPSSVDDGTLNSVDDGTLLNVGRHPHGQKLNSVDDGTLLDHPASVDDGTLLNHLASVDDGTVAEARHSHAHEHESKTSSVDDGTLQVKPTSVDDGTLLNVRRHPHEHQITSVDDGTLATTRHAHAHEPEHNAKPNSVDDGTLLKKLNSVDDGTIAQTRHAHPHEHQPKVKQSSVDDGTIVLISVDDGTFVTKRAREDSEDDGSASVKEVRAVHDVGADVGAARRVIATKARALGQIAPVTRGSEPDPGYCLICGGCC